MIKTDRLIMRPFKLSDQEFLYLLNNDEKVNEFRSSLTATMDYCIKSIKDWNEKYGHGLLNVYLMACHSNNEPIGLVAIFKRDHDSVAELGYRTLPQYWGQGYCSEAVIALITKYFTETNENDIFAETHPDNIKSIKFLENNKFIEEKHDMKDIGKMFYTRREYWLEENKTFG